MKAIRIHNYGGPEVLKYEDAPRPEPQADEVLIRINAAGVNPIDWKIRAGHRKDIFPVSFPLILGWDLSGVIEEVGPSATRFKKGDEVLSMPDPTRNGAYAEYIVVRESEVALKPKSLHHVRAAAISLAALTAWHALFDTAELRPGQRVLIHGGDGGVGHYAVQLAKWKGAHVIATSSTKNHDLLRELAPMRQLITPRRNSKASRAMSMLCLTQSAARNRNVPGRCLRRAESWLRLSSHLRRKKLKRLAFAAQWSKTGRTAQPWQRSQRSSIREKLAPVIDRILPLSEVRRAHELSQSGQTHGKIALRVSNGDGTFERKTATLR